MWTILTCCLLSSFGEVRPNPTPVLDRHGDPLPEGVFATLGTLRFRSPSTIRALAYAPDGKTLASTGDGKLVHLWDVETGREVRRFSVHDKQATITSLAFSPNGKAIAVCGSEGVLGLFDPDTGKLILRLQQPGFVHTLAFSPDGAILATAGSDKIVQLWNPVTGKEQARLEGHEARVSCVAFSPDGKTLASGDHAEEGTVRVWNVASARQLHLLRGHSAWILSLAFSPDGKTLATTTHGGDPIRLWDLTTGKQIGRWQNSLSSNSRLLFLDDRTLLSAGSFGRPVCFWDPATGQEKRRCDGAVRLLNALALSPDRKTIAAADRDTIRLWDAASGKEIRPLAGHDAPVRSLAFTPDGKLLSTSGEQMLLWDLHTADAVLQMPAFDQPDRLAVSADGKWFASSSLNFLRIMESSTGKQLHQIHRNVRNLAFAPDGKTVAILCEGGIALYDPVTGKEVRQLMIAEGVWALAFSPDSKTLAVGQADYRLWLWDPATGKQLDRWKSIDGGFSCLAWSSDGRLLASASSIAPVVRLWDAAGKNIYRLQGHKEMFNEAMIHALTFSRDGRLLASAGEDGTVRLWETFTGQEIRSFREPFGPARSIAFSPDGRTLASGGGRDPRVRLWDVTGRRSKAKLESAKSTAKELQGFWSELASADAGRAHRSVWALVAAEDSAVVFLDEHLGSAVMESKRIARLIEDLGNDQFAVRQRAVDQLSALGSLAAPALKQRLDSRPPLELRRRIEALLARAIGPEQEARDRRLARAIYVLEQIGSSSARSTLKILAETKDQPLLAREARAAMQRLP